MRKSEACPSKFFRAKNHPDDWAETYEIEMSRMENFQNGKDNRERLVVYFRRVQSGLVCGPTIWDQLAEATSEEDSDNWPGHRVTLFRDWTNFQGSRVECIRVRKPDEPAKRPAKKPPKKAPEDDKPDFNDSVEF
jgi:hypothetical protein